MDLSTELLVHILDQIPVEVYYPSTIYHVMLSCRRLSTIAMPHLYRKLTFNFPQTEERMDPDSPNPFRDYDGMLLLHPERAAWAQSASFTYSFKRPDLWDHMANILPKLSFLQTLDIGAGLGHPDPFGEFVNLAVPNPTSHRLSHDRNLMDLFDVCCGDLEFLHSVRVMDRIITIQEAWAMFALPNIRNLELRTLNEIEGPYTASNDTPPPSLLLSFSLTADMLPNAHIVQPLFERLSALKVLRWSAEHPQPSSNFHDSLERWSPKAIENAISPCKSTLSELQLYNTLVQQLIVLPHIDLHDFSVLSVLKISARILFSHALRTSYSERMRNRKDYVKRLPRNIKYLEACNEHLKWQSSI